MTSNKYGRIYFQVRCAREYVFFDLRISKLYSKVAFFTPFWTPRVSANPVIYVILEAPAYDLN